MNSSLILLISALTVLLSVPVYSNSDDEKLLISTRELVAEGKEKFKKLCSSCHGESGDGKTPVAGAQKPLPRNFLDPKTEWKFGREPVEIYRTIVLGSPGTSMVGFGNSLKTEKDRWVLVHFLNSLDGCKGKFTPVSKKNLQKNLEAVKKIKAAESRVK